MTTGAAPAASVSIVFAEPGQGAPLARASSRIRISGSPLSMRRDGEGGDLSVGGHQGNGMWHLGFEDCVSDLLFDSRNYFVVYSTPLEQFLVLHPDVVQG